MPVNVYVMRPLARIEIVSTTGPAPLCAPHVPSVATHVHERPVNWVAGGGVSMTVAPSIDEGPALRTSMA